MDTLDEFLKFGAVIDPKAVLIIYWRAFIFRLGPKSVHMIYRRALIWSSNRSEIGPHDLLGFHWINFAEIFVGKVLLWQKAAVV